jgi:hypothetical protein
MARLKHHGKYFCNINGLKIANPCGSNGGVILNDFHPFRKVMPINFFKSSVEDYFDTNIHNGDVAYKDFLDEVENEESLNCSYRLYNISEIIKTFKVDIIRF